MVGQPVEQRSGAALGAEHLGPFVERQVAGDQRGASFVALGDKFEQEFRAGLAEGDEAQFVDDQQLVADELFLQTYQPALIARLH